MSDPPRLFDVLFSEHNSLRPDQATHFAPFIRRLERAAPGAPPPESTITPVRNHGGAFLYAIPASAEAVPVLLEDLRACLGRTFLGPRITRIDFDDSIDVAVRRATDENGWKHSLPIPDKDLRQSFADAVRRLECVQRLAPAMAQASPSAGQIYRGFRAALSAGDREGAQTALDQLRRRALVDVSNALFLELELIAALDGDHALLNWSGLGDALSAPRPAAANAAVAGAVARVHLDARRAEAEPAAVLAAVASKGVAPFSPALDTPHACRDTDARLAFIASAVAAGRRPLAAELAEGLTGHPARAAEALLGTLDDPPADHQLDTSELVERGLYPEAVAALLPTPPSPQKVALLIECAHGAGRPDFVGIASHAFDELTADERDAMRRDPALRHRIDTILGRSDDNPRPKGWVEAFEYLRVVRRSFADGPIIRSLVENWSLADLAADPSQINRLADVITATDPPGTADAVSSLKTDLVGALQLLDEPIDTLAPVAVALLENLAYQTAGSPAELVQLADLVECALVQPASAHAGARYRQVLEICDLVAQSYLAEKTADAIVDLAEIVAERPVLDPSACQRFFDTLAAWLHAQPTEPRSTRWSVLRSLAIKAGLKEWADATLPSRQTVRLDDEVPPLSRWNGRRIGIYTLMEPAGRRAAEIIREVAPDAEVRIFSEHAAEQRMVDWAQRADVFILCKSAAKHAATNAIKDARGDRETREPRGKGSSAILAALAREGPAG